MQHWNVGKVEVTRIVELGTPTPYRAKAPFIAEATRRFPRLYPHFKVRAYSGRGRGPDSFSAGRSTPE